jgi:sialate O-acetylesterase
VVQTDQVEDPRHVRFGFSNTAQPNLFNKAGLPASPFTTEDSTDAK